MEKPAGDRCVSLRRMGAVLTVALAIAVITALALRRLNAYPYPLDLRAALDGAATTAAATGPAALATWSIVTALVFAVGRWLKGREPGLSSGEAAAGATVLLWAGSYVALLALAPFGLYRPSVLWVLLIAVMVATLRIRRAQRPRERWPMGAWIAALAVALAVVPLLLLQLGSPVSPFMDVLPYMASTQKIVTFRHYDPLDNNASGLLGLQVAGWDAPFSLLALLTGMPAYLVITSLMVPLAILQVLGLYLLGRAIGGSMAGGMATLFLLQTFTWRRTMDGRGTALAFFLVAFGLAFLFGRDRGAMRAVLGGLALGLAVAVNPLIGAVGMQVAAVAAVVAWIDLGQGLFAPVMALAAGTVFALPEVLIGVAWPMPPWLPPLIAAGGGGLFYVLGRIEPSRERRAWPLVRLLLLLAVPLAMLYIHAGRQSWFLTSNWLGYVLLMVLGAGGLAVLASEVWRQPARWQAAAVPAIALLIAIIDHGIAIPLRLHPDLKIRYFQSEITPKMVSYWWPYWLALLAGILFSLLARRRRLVTALVLALILVIYPLREVEEPLDYDGAELSLAETWGFHLEHAAHGYWAGRFDRRWVLDENWSTLARVLLDEVAAGRITYHTHVLYVTPEINRPEIALATGVSIDIVTPQYSPENLWTGHSRARGLDVLPAALARYPRYVLVEGPPPRELPPLTAYDELLARPQFRLYRLRDDASTEPAAPSS